MSKSAGTLDAEVKGRVPKSYLRHVNAEVKKLKEKFRRASKSDVVRIALDEYFASRGIVVDHSATTKNGRAEQPEAAHAS